MKVTIISTYGLTKDITIHPNIKQINIKPTIPYATIIIKTYKNPNHTSSIPLFNENEIIIDPEIIDKIYPKLDNK